MPSNQLKVEIGGGRYPLPKDRGYINVDQIPTADVIHDLDVYEWPFSDESVGRLYSSHCFEHLKDPDRALQEVARICVVGAHVEIKVPHPRSDMAMCPGHVSVISPIHILNVVHYFPENYWTGARRLYLQNIQYGCSVSLTQAYEELPFIRDLPAEVVMRWIPGTCHETIFTFTVGPVNDASFINKKLQT